MSNFSIDMVAKSEKLKSNSILLLDEQNIMLSFIEIETNVPKLTEKEFCNQLGFSDSTIKRYRDDINMDTPYNKKKNKKKSSKSNTSTTETQTHTPSEQTTNNKDKEKLKRTT